MALAGARPPKQHAGTRAAVSAEPRADDVAEDLRWLKQRARAIVRSEDLARDLVQETFLAWVERPPELRQGLRAWLEGVLRNQLRMRSRTTARRENRELQATAPAEQIAVATPEGLLDRARVTALIERELDELAEPYRTTLRLRYWENLRPVEIAQRLGVPQSTVRRRCLVAHAMLRARLELRFGDREDLDATFSRAFALPLPWFVRLRRGASALLRAATVPLVAVASLVLMLFGVHFVAAPGGVRSELAARRLSAPERLASLAFDDARLPAIAFDEARLAELDGPAEPFGPVRRGDERASPTGRGANASGALATCGPLVQARVDAARPWDTIRLPGGCVFREAVRIDKPLVIDAEPGAELRGSDVLTFVRAGDTWVSEASVPSDSSQHCTPTSAGVHTNDAVCVPFELVFVDGVRLPAAQRARPAAGEWTLDDRRRVVLGASPDGHVVEAAVRTTVLTIAASDVVVRGLTVRHAMGGPRKGAIEVASRLHGVRFEGVHAFDAGGPMLVFRKGRDHAFIDGEIAGAGGPGILAWISERLTVAGSRVHHNGLAHRNDVGWITGGIKSEAGSIDVRGNLIDGNHGEGVVCVGCIDSHVHGNTVRDNAGAGVIVMHSERSIVERNRLWRNGFGFTPARAAMLVVESTAVRVVGNVLAFHDVGVAVLPQDRANLPDDYDACEASHDNDVDDNVIVSTNAPLFVSGDPRPARTLPPCRSNRASANGIWSLRSPVAAPDAVRRGTRTLTERERDELLARYRMPAAAAL